ncbi:MAG: hypothetical protein MJ252_07575 [archaeon]|nr:hypothetical protein [archaeon]
MLLDEILKKAQEPTDKKKESKDDNDDYNIYELLNIKDTKFIKEARDLNKVAVFEPSQELFPNANPVPFLNFFKNTKDNKVLTERKEQLNVGLSSGFLMVNPGQKFSLLNKHSVIDLSHNAMVTTSLFPFKKKENIKHHVIKEHFSVIKEDENLKEDKFNKKFNEERFIIDNNNKNNNNYYNDKNKGREKINNNISYEILVSPPKTIIIPTYQKRTEDERIRISVNKPTRNMIEKYLLEEKNNNQSVKLFDLNKLNENLKNNSLEAEDSKENKEEENKNILLINQNRNEDSPNLNLLDDFINNPYPDIITKEENKTMNKENLQGKNKLLKFQNISQPKVNYDYMLNDFNLEPDESFNFWNPQLISDYMNYMERNNFVSPNIDFGKTPIEVFNDWYTWLKYEKERKKGNNNSPMLTNSDLLISDLGDTLNAITSSISSLVVIKPSSLDNYIGNKRKREDPVENKQFVCEVCNESFTTAQGLGKHISIRHQEEASRLMDKFEINQRRKEKRNLLVQAKKLFCKKYDIDYDSLSKTKQGRNTIEETILKNFDEFKKFKMKVKFNIKKEVPKEKVNLEENTPYESMFRDLEWKEILKKNQWKKKGIII